MSAEYGFRGARFEVKTNVERSENLGEDNGCAEDKDHGVEDDGERALTFHLVVIGTVAVENGDEGDGGGAADEEVVDEFGEVEGDVVGVGVMADAESVGDELFAQETEYARGKSGESEEQSCRGCSVAVRGAKKIKGTTSAWRDGRIGVFVYSHAELILSAEIMLWGSGGGSLAGRDWKTFS